MKTEKRFIEAGFETREDKKDKVISGYGAKFNSRSQNFGTSRDPFYEIIAPGAFDSVMGDDVRALVNHEGGLMTLARTKSKTLTLEVDAVGLRYTFTPPDTQAGRDIHEIISRGDIDQSSFSFMVARDGQTWETVIEDDKEVTLRTITKFERLLDVSPVTFPAYADTMVEARGLDEYKEQRKNLSKQKVDEAARARQIKLAELA